MENNSLKIEIQYCRKDGVANLVNIPALEYFETPDEEEILEYDSTPKHLEQYEYTKENFEDLDWSILRINDNSKSLMMVCEEKYWGDKNCHRMLIVSLFKNDEMESWEKTIEISDKKAETIHILKLSTSSIENVGGLISHTIIDGPGPNENVMFEYRREPGSNLEK